MTTREKRFVEADRVANRIIEDYGTDPDCYEDRILTLVHGQRWLERMVKGACKRICNEMRGKYS